MLAMSIGPIFICVIDSLAESSVSIGMFQFYGARFSASQRKKVNQWSSAEKPKKLMKALANSHYVISALDEQKLIGLANSISDGYLVVYYPHLLLMPEYQGRGIGKALVAMMKNKYCNFHQQILVADGGAINFYKSCSFKKAGSCEPLWIYDGRDHD